MKLAKRERLFIALAACAVVLFILIELLIIPFFKERAHMKRTIVSKQVELRELLESSAKLKALKNNSLSLEQSLARRVKGFALFSYLEKAAGRAEVKENIKYMKPSTSKGSGDYKESTVELKIEAITLEQLVQYLYHIESKENVVYVKRISIKENKAGTGYVEAVLQVLTFMK
jgi:general secretion pathway protein M